MNPSGNYVDNYRGSGFYRLYSLLGMIGVFDRRNDQKHVSAIRCQKTR